MICDTCGIPVSSLSELTMHKEFCLERGKEVKSVFLDKPPVYKKVKFVSYNDLLQKAARKEPGLYKKYTLRSNPACPEGIWNPLARKKSLNYD